MSMMKYIPVCAFFFLVVLHTSCGQTQTDSVQVSNSSKTQDIVASPRSDEGYHTHYEYTDADGKRLIIQNSFPKGGNRYTDPNGEVLGYAVFWTRIINETDNPLDLQIDFPVESYEVPFLPGKYFSVLLPPDIMTRDKEALFNYGLTDLESFIDKNIHKPASLKRTINSKESGSFYVVILSNRNPNPKGGGALRSGLSLKGGNLFYGITCEQSDNAIPCGTINLNLK